MFMSNITDMNARKLCKFIDCHEWPAGEDWRRLWWSRHWGVSQMKIRTVGLAAGERHLKSCKRKNNWSQCLLIICIFCSKILINESLHCYYWRIWANARLRSKLWRSIMHIFVLHKLNENISPSVITHGGLISYMPKYPKALTGTNNLQRLLFYAEDWVFKQLFTH